MKKILVCIDDSVYAQAVCDAAAWVSQRTGAAVVLLHVFTPPPKRASRDLSGAIGLGAKSELLEQLTELDENHGRVEQRKGKLMLTHAEQQLRAAGVQNIEVLHRRGSLVEVIGELEVQMDLIIMGKRGEHADFDTLHLGANLERVARAVHKPLLVTARTFQPIRQFLIAFDGSPSASKALEYIASHSLLQNLKCHVLMVGHINAQVRNTLTKAANTLEQAGIGVHTALKVGPRDEVIADYVAAKEMDLIVMGAYGHSRMRQLIIGSTTTAVIRSCHVPLLLFR
ncbi:MAG: universal stress protein [Gammaproteobacteria bacterium]